MNVFEIINNEKAFFDLGTTIRWFLQFYLAAKHTFQLSCLPIAILTWMWYASAVRYAEFIDVFQYKEFGSNQDVVTTYTERSWGSGKAFLSWQQSELF